MNIEQHPVIALVVDRRTGRVVDSERFTYGPYLSELIARHDLFQYDIVLRAAVDTQPPEVAPALDHELGEDEFSSKEQELSEDPSLNGADDSGDDVPF
jgi:hypothetical protein